MVVMNSQLILENVGLHAGDRVNGPYNLIIEVGDTMDIEEMCHSDFEIKTLQGLLGICQGVLFTITNSELDRLLHFIVVINPHMGVVIAVRDFGVSQYLNLDIDIESLIWQAMEELNIAYVINNFLAAYTITYMEFSEAVDFWENVRSGRVIYSLIDNYSSTLYSVNTRAEEFARRFISGEV